LTPRPAASEPAPCFTGAPHHDYGGAPDHFKGAVCSMDKHIEKISKHIKAFWPDSEISIIKSERDHVGPLLSVRSKSGDGLEQLARSLDHIVVEIGESGGMHLLVIPLAPENTAPRRLS
jgi:hypothetical protein